MTLKEYKENSMKNPEFAKAYEEIEPELNVIRAIIDARISQNMTQKELAEKTETGTTGTSAADENAASTAGSATEADAADATAGAGGSASSSCDLNAEELAQIESDFKHMENSFFLDQEFTDEEDIPCFPS